MKLDEIFDVIDGNNFSNCSIYFLTSGFFTYQLANPKTWIGNNSVDPSTLFYITNCSSAELTKVGNFLHETVIKNDKIEYPYNEHDSADDFIAMLFTTSGICASSWILSSMQFLSPKHKRKTWLAIITTLMFSIMTTIVLNRLTRAASHQYYKDVIDIVTIHRRVYNDRMYQVFYTVSQLLVNFSWLEMMLYMCRKKHRWYVGILVGFLVAVYMAVLFVFEFRFNNLFSKDLNNAWSKYRSWRFTRIILRLLIVFAFLLSVLQYTIVYKTPSKVSYTRKLFPLALVTHSMFMSIFVINILVVSYFRYNWQRAMWVRFLPSLFEVILITLVWEWIRNIELLEKRQELADVLGRRISIDDVLDLHKHSNSNNIEPLPPNRDTGVEYLLHWGLSKTVTILDTLKRAFSNTSPRSSDTVVFHDSGNQEQLANPQSLDNPSQSSGQGASTFSHDSSNFGPDNNLHAQIIDGAHIETADSIYISNYDFEEPSSSSLSSSSSPSSSNNHF